MNTNTSDTQDQSTQMVNVPQVTITIHNQSGHLTVVEPIPTAIAIIKEQVEKFGKWLYVGNNRFKLDPKDPSSLTKLETVLSASPVTPTVRVTGALRGGAPKVTKVKEIKEKVTKAKKPKVIKEKIAKVNKPKVTKKSKVNHTTDKAIVDLGTVQLPIPEVAETQIGISDDPVNISLEPNQTLLCAFVLDRSTKAVVYLGDTNLTKKFINHIGSALLEVTK